MSAQELTPVYLRLSQAERERLAKGESICGGLLQGESPVLPEALQRPAIRQESGVVDLLPPGIHGADNTTISRCSGNDDWRKITIEGAEDK